jgi:acetyl esterase/lipase
MNKAELFFATIENWDKVFRRRGPKDGTIKKIADRKYGEDDNQTFDIYFDEDNKKTMPVLINVHGGGFVNGDKINRDYLCNMFAVNGWFVVNTNYRLCPAVQIHEQVKDIYTVLSAMPTLKYIYNIDDKKIVLTGDSAGAYLAGYTEAVLTNPKLRDKLRLPPADIDLAGLLLYSGCYDLPKLLPQKILFNMSKDIGECITGIKSKNIKSITKYRYFDDLSLPQFVNNKWCPTMLSYSADDLFTKGQGEHLQSVLLANNVPVYTHIANTKTDNHNYHLTTSAAAKEAFVKSVDFLDDIKSSPEKKSKFTIKTIIDKISERLL